ncbi:MAG: [FeFe] hydrogenase H-cluster radical SAM maturase HydG [Phycisphaerae bacterium]|nr:[FeFe] hydrogenase H-cluster radical SAM maturase HydG [Phycisphaerae bacterium]
MSSTSKLSSSSSSSSPDPIPINEGQIEQVLKNCHHRDAVHVREILAKSLELKGLDLEDVAVLANISDPGLLGEMFDAARRVKQAIYGSRLVLFAPMYVSNLCANECTYCAFRVRNKEIQRRALTQEEIAAETLALIQQGHKRVLLVAGESYPDEGFNYVLKSIETIYATRSGNGEIRRVNANIAPLSTEEFQQLKGASIGTYQLFQETYHRETYAKMHLAGRKRNYDWRVTAMDRAMQAGIDDVGVGVLFGLFDWRFELLALMQHAKHLDQKFGVGPHTISVPRLEPASGSSIASQPPHAVSDVDFRKIVAILRLAVPYTGIIMSTRETPNIRRETFSLGVSQISAGSRTNPGGYTVDGSVDDSTGGSVGNSTEQFSLGDHRPLDEVVRNIAELGYIPSFCTACYRLGRTGRDFMDLAKPGEIKNHCDPNAISTFLEYLIDFASPETKAVGERLIEQLLSNMDPRLQQISRKMMDVVRTGKRDVFM